MANTAQVKAVITAEDKASSVLKGFADNASNVGSKIAGAAKIAAEGLLAAGAAATAFGALSVKAFMESQDVQAQLTATLKSTHQAAGLYIEDLNDQALAMQKLTKYSDEQINSSQALLLTFTNIKGGVFQEATNSILDLATAMHEDLQSATIQVGKALNDPILGITALHRIGVTFSQTQKDQIKHFMDTNQLAKAQGVILKELSKEFGGSAVAAGKTFGGQLIILKNQLNDVEEKIGQVIVTKLTPFISKALAAVAAIDWTAVIDNTIRSIKELGGWLDRMWQKFDKVYQQIEHFLQPKLEALAHSLEAIAPVIRKFIDEYINPLAEVLAITAGKSLVWAIGMVIDALNLLITVATPVLKFLDDHRVVVEMLAAAFGALALKMALGAAFDAIRVGFATMQLVQIPALIASLTSLGAAFVAAMPYAIVAAFVIWFANQMGKIKSTYDDMYNHIAGVSADAQRIQAQAVADYKAGKITKQQYTKILQIAAAEADSVVQHRAAGGDVVAGQRYRVGESGPEEFVPSTSGQIIPNNRTGGGSPINITIQAGAFTGSQMDARRHAMTVFKALKELAAAKNTTVSSLIGVTQ